MHHAVRYSGGRVGSVWGFCPKGGLTEMQDNRPQVRSGGFGGKRARKARSSRKTGPPGADTVGGKPILILGARPGLAELGQTGSRQVRPGQTSVEPAPDVVELAPHVVTPTPNFDPRMRPAQLDTPVLIEPAHFGRTRSSLIEPAQDLAELAPVLTASIRS